MKTLVTLSALVAALTMASAAHATPTPETSPVVPNAGTERSLDGEASRVVTGRVVKVDADAGTLVIQTPVGLIALRGPGEDLRRVSVGDVVEVEMVGEDDAPSASPSLEVD
jgi:hypothetical protein